MKTPVVKSLFRETYTCVRYLEDLFYDVHPGRHLDYDSPQTQKAIRAFIERVEMGLVFGEIENPKDIDDNVENFDKALKRINLIDPDNVCLQIVSARLLEKGKILIMEIIPTGRYLNALPSIGENYIALDARAMTVVDNNKPTITIDKLITFDLSGIYRK